MMLRLFVGSLAVLVLLFFVGLSPLEGIPERAACAVFSLTVLLLCIAPLSALGGEGRGRLEYLAFTIFGWAYLMLTITRQAGGPQLFLSVWVTALLTKLDVQDSDDFLIIAHSLASLLFGMAAAFVMPFFIKPGRTKQADADAPDRPKSPA